MNKFELITCPDCGGKGQKQYYTTKSNIELKYVLSGGSLDPDTCTTCKGQPLYQKLIEVKVPKTWRYTGDCENYDFNFACFNDNTDNHERYPHMVGETIKEVCEKCNDGFKHWTPCPKEQSFEALSIEVKQIEDKWYFDVKGMKV